MKEVYLYGAGGHAKVVIDILKSRDTQVKAILDDNPEMKELLHIPVVQEWRKMSPLIISIGHNELRRRIAEQLGDIPYARAIDSSAVVSDSATVGEGTVVMQRAVIQSSARIGKHIIVNSCSSIDHDCVIGDFAHIAPGSTLCGNVTVGEGAFIGAGTVIIPGVKIGKWSIIGAGSVVINDIPDHVVAIGNPCKTIKKRNYEA